MKAPNDQKRSDLWLGSYIGTQTAPQPLEKMESAPGDGKNPITSGPKEGASSGEDLLAASVATKQAPTASPVEFPPHAMERAEPTAAALAPHFAPVRRMNIWMLLSGVEACRAGYRRSDPVSKGESDPSLRAVAKTSARYTAMKAVASRRTSNV